jgi:hypothetical protein
LNELLGQTAENLRLSLWRSTTGKKTGAAVRAECDFNASAPSTFWNCDDPALEVIAPLIPDIVIAAGGLLQKSITASDESLRDTGSPLGTDAAISVS